MYKLLNNSKQAEIECVAYGIPCECHTIYVGETGRSLHIRVQEHKWEVCRRDTNSGKAAQVMKTNHNIQWKKAQTILAESHPSKMRMKEPW